VCAAVTKITLRRVRSSRFFFQTIKEDEMLVLARKPGETIYIGKDIEITVMRVSGNNVKLAIKAPDGVKILRAELRKKEN